jgi:hypothetical protein
MTVIDGVVGQGESIIIAVRVVFSTPIKDFGRYRSWGLKEKELESSFLLYTYRNHQEAIQKTVSEYQC